MVTFSYSTTGQYRGIGADNGDLPPIGSEEDRIDEISSATRSAESENAIRNHVMAAFALSLIPVPVFDVAALTANQVKMVHTLGAIHDVQSIHGSRVKAIVLSLVSGALPVLGVQGLSAGFKAIPGIGTLVGSGSVAVSGSLLTYAVGRVFVKHFESGGTYLNFDMERARDQLRKEMERGRRVFFNFRNKAQGA